MIRRTFGLPLTGVGYLLICLALSLSCLFLAVQGESGILAQRELDSEIAALTGEKERLAAELASLQNLTHRLSDAFLDLELLDERARAILGYIRTDEIILR